ncbi:MAG TPA: class 1 fructose-bisphosphatase [Steroidobacter sp.]|nr:class 1 fructose-bisphosphatase [Steroidobacteraceae bacterium]HLS81983.1 class 1 fructose-bisphosphatase [Steroidobacter sp.]
MAAATQPSDDICAPADIVTLQAHILQQQARHPEASGALSWILSALSISAKVIAAHVRRARLDDVLGAVGGKNVQGEQQQKLDVIANDILLRTLGGREGVAIVASEENEEPVILRADDGAERKYCVLFDPLDGSSNLDVCGSVGTIFSILRKDRRSSRPESSLLQCGREQVAAGYVLYGSSTVFVLTIGLGVDMFVLDPAYGAFMRVAQGLRIPAANKCYSVNEGNRLSFPEGYQKYLSWAQQSGYSSRYVGAMVADVHRILLQGGVFMYPPTKKAPNGKLRLMYEANPMAMLVEQAGGKALCGPGRRILDEPPSDIHQRTPVVLGSAQEVDHVLGNLGV